MKNTNTKQLVKNMALVIAILMLSVASILAQPGVGINTDGSSPNSNALLDVKSTATIGKGVLFPRFTLAQRTVNSTSGGLLNSSGNLHGGAAQGLLIYQTDGTQGFYYNTSTTSTPTWNFLGNYTFSTGLTNSSNTITANLSTGVAGGQTAIGGTAAGNSLTLSSTSNATKGKIIFGTSAYDEVNNRLGIGKSSPSYALEVNGDGMFGTGSNTYATTPAGAAAITLNGSTVGGVTRLVMNDGSGTFNMYQNAYFDGTNHKYMGAAEATRMISSGGVLSMQVASAGTAGNNITWKNGLYIDNSANVGVGTISPVSKLDVYNGNLSITNNDNTARELRLYEPSSSGTSFTSFKAQTQTADLTYVLPAAQASSASLALINDGLGNLSWGNPAAISTFTTSSYDLFEDFVFDAYAGNGSNDNQFSFTVTTNSGASDVLGATVGNDYMGGHQLSTLASSTARPNVCSFNNVNLILFGGKQIVYEGRIRVETLSATGQVFTTFFGLMDGNAAGTPVNGVYFSYTNGTNSGRWVASTVKASAVTTVNSNVTVTANQWYKVRAVINPSGTNVDFYIDDVLIGSSTTNIPTVAQRVVFKMEKSTGSTARTSSLDYVALKMAR